jgi:hypothetical protein
MSNGDKRKVFTNHLINVLDHYIQHPGLFAALLGGAAHQQLAVKMKLEAKHFFNEPTDENWGILVKAFNVFHEALVEQESQSLLTAINDFIRESEFPEITTVVFDFNQLNANAAALDAELTVPKPTAEDVIADLRRQLPLSISKDGHTPKPLSDYVHIQTDNETNKTVIRSLSSNQIIYQGITSTPEEAEKALDAIKKELDMPFDILSFMCQNGVLGLGKVGIAKIIIDGHPEHIPVVSSHEILVNVKQSDMTITESYIFKYKKENEHHEMQEYSFTTPVKAVESFHCKVSENGDTATITQRKVAFSASHETPKENAVAKQKNM